MSWLSNVVGWKFLNEPAYRWFIFLGVLILFLAVWNGVLRHM